MSRPPRMRPTFEIPLEPGDDVLARLQRRLERDDTDLLGQVITGHAMLRLPRQRRSLLSPVLNLELAEDETGRPVLKGRFSPLPNVWTGFMAIYGVLGLIGVAGLMWGFAKMTVDESPWPMLLLPICLALIGFVYGAAFIGQGLTTDDMYEMRAFVDEVAHGDQN